LANSSNRISRRAQEGTLRCTNCTNCGDELSSERSELGYTYCTRDECVAVCFEPVDVVALAVNKASDQFLLRRHLDLPEHPARPAASDDDHLGALGLAGRPPTERPRARATASRIARLESELDAALALESDPARRRKLVNDHNAKLRRLNIRYRRSAQRPA
jgi:hypothetical protein